MLIGGLAGLLTLLATWAWFHLGQAMPARGAGLLLLMGTVLAVVAALRAPTLRWDWRHPVPWLVLALGTLGIGWGWTPVPEPATFRVLERAAALATALGLGWWLARRPADQRAEILGVGAAVVLLANVIGQVTVASQPLGIALGLGLDPPFGNTNFNSGAVLPLLAVGLAGTRPRPGPMILLGLGVAAAAILGLGLINGDGNRAALVGLMVTLGVAGSLRAPSRWQAPLILTGLAIGLGLATWLLVAEHYPTLLGPSTGFRIGVWRAAMAAWWEHPLLGHGPAASLVALNRQDEYQMAWLAVPGYAEHAHSEPLEMLVEGGVLLVGLLGVALARCILPLWQTRDQHGPLLVGWAVAIAMGCLESHYGQPGALLGLAVLMGATLAALPVASGAALPRSLSIVAAGIVAIALSWSLVQELRWSPDSDQGHASPPVAEVLLRRRMDADIAAKDWPAVARGAARLQANLGPLTDLWLLQAQAAAHQRLNELAVSLTLRQAAVNPLLPGHIDLVDRLLPLARRKGWTEAVVGLEASRLHARRLILRGQALGWRGKDPKLVTWLEEWAARVPDQSSPSDVKPSSP